MATKATTLKDVLLLHSAKDAGDWTEFIQNEIKTFGLQIKEVDIKDLAASMKDIHILCAQYSVVSLVISEEMLKTIDSVASELSTTLQNHSYVTLIKLFIDDCEKELYSNVLPKYPSAKTWKTFKISDPDAQGKLQATVSSLINMVQDSQMVAKPAPSPSGDMLRTKSSHSTAKPKHSAQITVSPDSIRQGGETVLVVWYRAIPESYLVQVAIGENDDAKKLETKRINEYTFSFTAPSYKAGMTHMYVFMDGKKCLKRMIKYSGMCEFAYTYPEFLCQLIDLDAADHTGLDNYLTTVFQSSTPADWSMANMLTHRNIILPVGSKKSDSELPTLLHFACKYSLNSLASSIIDTPGAHEALEILNCRDKTPYDIAKEMNNEDLIGYIDVFLEMVDYNTQIEDLYTRMKNGQLADYSHTPNKEIGDGYLIRSSPGSFVTDGVAEDDYERTDKTSHQVVVVDENEDINEPSEQAPTVPRRKPSQLRSPEQPSPPVVTRTPSINSGNRVERPIHPPSYNPKAMCMMPDDDAMGGKETGDGYLKMGGSPGSFVYKGRVPEDDYERTDKTSSQVVEVDEDEDIHEPTEQAPPVPRRKSSQLRTPEQTSPPAVNRTPSSYPGNRSERQPAQPIRHPSLGESFNPNMTPDDDPKGESRDLLSPGSMGSSALNESNEIIESYKLGGIGMDDVDKLYCAWQGRNKDSSKSIKEKKQHLESLRSFYEDVGSKKKGGLFSRLTKRKAEKKQVEIEHHVNTGARSNSYRTWDIMKKPSWPHRFSNRESTASNTSTSSSSSDKSQDSAIEMIEEDDIVVRRPRDANTDTEAKRQSWGQRYLAIKQQPRKTATLPNPPPRNPTINQLIQGSRPPARKESPPPVPRRNRDSTGSNTSNSIWEYMKKHSELHPSSDKESTTSDNSTSSSSSVISQDSAISMIEESKPKKPPPLVQPAVSKPGPPKLPDKGPVISAEQSKPEPEKDKKVVKGDTELRAISLEQTTPVDLGNKVNNIDTKTRLRELCFTHGRTSKHLQEFCKSICTRFLQVSEIIDAYPAYKVGNEENIVFVLTVKSNIIDIHQHLVDFDVETIIKTVSLDIHEDDVAITDDFKENDKDIERLKECISNNADDLMQQHKYLNIIRGGSNKPIEGSKREPCLVLYVHAKGFIPIDEEPFKKSYNGINVEVREGRFTPYINHADVLLNKVRMGCKIEGHQTGTLGVFIEHPSYGICGITCAHVAISATEMEDCKSESGRLLWEKINPSKKCIYQPSRINGEFNQFGQIVEVIYKEGKSSETGIEIALIQIEKRHPDSGKFPTPRSLSNSDGSDYTFASGKTCGPTRFNTNNHCFKVGSVTDFTEGTIEMRAPNVVRTDKHTWDYDHLRITLYNQFLVRPKQEAFADFGDSGSPVFVKDEETGEPVCIGLVEGGLTAGGLVVVTPITKILEELGISQLKAFPKNVMQELEQIKLTLHVLQTQNEKLFKHLNIAK